MPSKEVHCGAPISPCRFQVENCCKCTRAKAHKCTKFVGLIVGLSLTKSRNLLPKLRFLLGKDFHTHKLTPLGLSFFSTETEVRERRGAFHEGTHMMMQLHMPYSLSGLGSVAKYKIRAFSTTITVSLSLWEEERGRTKHGVLV